MSATKSIFLETDILAAMMVHDEERDKYSPENISNLTNPLDCNIEAKHDTFVFKEAIRKLDRLEFVEDTRKEIDAHKYEKHWTLVRRRELSGKKTIIYLWYLKSKRSSNGRCIKHKSCLCSRR